jgi:hypothetical protein
MLVFKAADITFLTIVVGPILGLAGLTLARFSGRPIDGNLSVSVISNGAALVPIVCLIVNMVNLTWQTSKNGSAPTDNIETFGEMIVGNEVVFTLALLFSAVMLSTAIWRNIKANPNA